MSIWLRKNVSFSVVLALAVQLATSVSVYAGKTVIQYEGAEHGDLIYLMEGEHEIPGTPGAHDAFVHSDQAGGKGNILFLGDGFDNPNWVPLAEVVQGRVKGSDKRVSDKIEIWKTGYDCPESLNGKKQDNLNFKRVDHTVLPLPFPLNQFDTTVMRRGLCHCHRNEVTCGGITLGKKGSKQGLHFFYEVAGTLNKDNPNAIAFLHGSHHAPFTGESSSVEANSEKDIEKIMKLMEFAYPALNVEMVYVSYPVQVIMDMRFDRALNKLQNDKKLKQAEDAFRVWQKSGDYSGLVSVSDLKNKDTGKFVESVPVFQGVKMTVKAQKGD